MSYSDRRLKLNLSDRQMYTVMALINPMVINHGDDSPIWKKLRADQEEVAAQLSGDLDGAMSSMLDTVETIHSRGEGGGWPDRILNHIGGYTDPSTSTHWNVPNVYAVALEDTRDWSVPQWIKDIGPFWTFTEYLVDDSQLTYCCSTQASQFFWVVDVSVVFWSDLDPSANPSENVQGQQRKARDWFEEAVNDLDPSYMPKNIIDEMPDRLIHHIGSPATSWDNLPGDDNQEKHDRWMKELSNLPCGDFQLGLHVLDCILLECQELPGGPGVLRRDPEIDHKVGL